MCRSRRLSAHLKKVYARLLGVKVPTGVSWGSIPLVNGTKITTLISGYVMTSFSRRVYFQIRFPEVSVV